MVSIVAINGQASGMQRISRLLGEIPADSGAAFVVWPQPEPAHGLQNTEWLTRATPLPVVMIRDRMPIVANRVHVIPLGHGLDIEDDVFRLTRDIRHEAVSTQIDRFFSTLASARRHDAVAIVLSGPRSPDAPGLRAIRAACGLLRERSPDDAGHDAFSSAPVQADGGDVRPESAVNPLSPDALEIVRHEPPGTTRAPEVSDAEHGRSDDSIRWVDEALRTPDEGRGPFQAAREHRSVDQRTRQSGLAYMQRMATAGDMNRMLAHELNQPLSAINSYAGALTHMLQAGKTAETTAPLLRRIADEVARASDIIKQTRDFAARRDRGPEEIDVNELVHSAFALLENRAEKLNVDTRLDTRSSLPSVRGCAAQIEQVLVNLIANALDAMDAIDAGKRCLSAVTERCDSGDIRIVIADSGVGIEPDRIATIFDCFYTTKPGGLGMGLPVSRSIAERHGGRLWAKSRPGSGASFFLRLPVASAARAPHANEDNAGTHSGPTDC